MYIVILVFFYYKCVVYCNINNQISLFVITRCVLNYLYQKFSNFIMTIRTSIMERDQSSEIYKTLKC